MHKGQAIEKAVRQSGYSITEVAERARISRRHLYNIFRMENPDPELAIRVGKALHISFSFLLEYTETPLMQGGALSYQNELEKLRSDILLWQEKYIALLEEYNELLKGSKK